MISNEEQIKNAITKKAIGYNIRETIEEYAVSDGEEVLSKKKVMIKHFPPDVSAIKVYLLYYGEKTIDGLDSLSDEDLEVEKTRLLNYLKNKSESIKHESDFVEKVKENLEN